MPIARPRMICATRCVHSLTGSTRQLEREYDYLNSDEVVDKSIIINEYEFDDEGRRI